MKKLPLGKKAARPDAVKFKLKSYLTTAKLPKVPHKFGHLNLQTTPWGMLGNDKYGDCVWAGAAHETMLWNHEAGRMVNITEKQALSDYTAVTGFDPSKPYSDQGTDMQEAASYRRKTGIIDQLGNRHTIDAYLAIEPGDVTELKLAAFLFGAVGIGIEFPDYAMDQFDKGKPWSVVKGAPKPDEGHYIPGFAFDGSDFIVVTWGKAQLVTSGFMKKYVDEAIAYISLERLTNNKSLDGFDIAALRDDLAQLKAA